VDNTPHYNKETLFIGVATAGSTSWRGYGFTNHRITRAYDTTPLYGHNFYTNDTIGVLLNMDQGTLSYIKYGPDESDMESGRVVINMGIANRYINRSSNKYSIPCFYPCVGVRTNTERLRIRKYYSLSQKGCSINRIINQALYGKMMIYKWCNSYVNPTDTVHRFPQEFMHKVYTRYCSWIRNNTLLLRSRPGIDVILDINSSSFDALSPVITIPLRYGMKFTEKVENFDPIKGSIIGVSGGNKIWFASDSKTKDTVGAWFWHADDLALMILADVIQFDCGDNTGDLLHLDETSTLDELKVSFDSFIEIFYRNISTKDRDAEICRLATNAGNSFSIDPTSLPAQYLYNEFQSKEFDAIASCIRYIFLVCMNSIAGTVLPYTDFGVTDERHLHISTEFSKPNCHFEPFLVSAQHFHSLKPAILLKTKTSYWNAVIRETVTPTEPVREILDIPDDIDRDEIRGNFLEHLLPSFVRVLLYLLSSNFSSKSYRGQDCRPQQRVEESSRTY